MDIKGRKVGTNEKRVDVKGREADMKTLEGGGKKRNVNNNASCKYRLDEKER